MMLHEQGTRIKGEQQHYKAQHKTHYMQQCHMILTTTGVMINLCTKL